MVQIRGNFGEIVCWNCGLTDKFVISTSGDSMVHCGCGAKAGFYHDLLQSVTAGPQGKISANVRPWS